MMLEAVNRIKTKLVVVIRRLMNRCGCPLDALFSLLWCRDERLYIVDVVGAMLSSRVVRECGVVIVVEVR